MCQCSQTACLTPTDRVKSPRGDDGSGDVTIPSFTYFQTRCGSAEGRNHEGSTFGSKWLPAAPVLNTISGFHPRIPSVDLFSIPSKWCLFTCERQLLRHMYIYDGLRAGCQFFGENRCNLTQQWTILPLTRRGPR
jgi:hypothetical protein